MVAARAASVAIRRGADIPAAGEFQRANLEGVDRALDRGFGELAGSAQPLAEPDDAREGVDHMERMRSRMGDQQAAIIGAEIERGVKLFFRGGRDPQPVVPAKTRPAPATPARRRWALQAGRAPRALVRHGAPFPAFRSAFTRSTDVSVLGLPPVEHSLAAQGYGATRWNHSKRLCFGSTASSLAPCQRLD